MPHVFGEDRQADACWLSFLDPTVCPVPTQRDLLRQGIGPERILAQASTPDFSALAERLVQKMKERSGASLRNGVHAERPIQLVALDDPTYPDLLSRCDDAPPALFAVGELGHLRQPALAVVGARRASPLGLELCQRFCRDLAGAGLTIASGLALGVDGAAHRSALDAGGATVAVLPTGIDSVYPRRHQPLARDIADRGVVVSEFPPNTSPRRGNFHRRNRTLSGLALGTLVIEAGRPSGSLITANAAAEQGREVFALPWSLAHAGGVGCLHLLSQGANLALNPADVVAHLLPGFTAQVEPFATGLSATGSGPCGDAVLSSLGDELLTVDRIAERAGMPASECLRTLAMLELSGRVARQQGLWTRTGA